MVGRMISGMTTSVISDSNGNTLYDTSTSGDGRFSTWDTQNWLIACTCFASNDYSAPTSAFTYGNGGLRRRGVVTTYGLPPTDQSQHKDGDFSNFVTFVPLYGPVTGSTQTDYVYDGTLLVEEIVRHFDSSGTATDSPTTITYLQGPSGPLYRKSSAATDPSWYVYDGLGSVVGEVDVNGNMTASKLFDVYGATRSYSGTPTTRQGFVGGLGHESDDETGLVYMRARYYDPGTGRFANEDPARNGLNWFRYCGDNPTNAVDRSGKAGESPFDSYEAFEALDWEAQQQAMFAYFAPLVGVRTAAILISNWSMMSLREIANVIIEANIEGMRRGQLFSNLALGAIVGAALIGVIVLIIEHNSTLEMQMQDCDSPSYKGGPCDANTASNG